MSIAAFGVRKPVVANLVMAALIFAGIVFGVTLRKEFFPETDPTLVSISAPYPGASPQEVEDSLAIKIEDGVRDLNDVSEITTTASTGAASVIIEFEDGTDITERLFEVKREMDALQDLPPEADRIVVNKLEPNLPAISVSIRSDADQRTLKQAVRAMRRDLESLPGMGTIAEDGILTDEITVEVDPAATLKHGLALDAVSAAISSAMTELPAGAVRTGSANVAIRTMGAEETAEEVRRIVVKALPGGQVLRVEDIATVTPGFADVDVRTRLNAKPAVSLTVFKEGKQDAVVIADMVKAYADGRNGKPFTKNLTERFLSLVQRPGSDDPVSSREQAWRLGANNPTPVPGELIVTTDLARFIVGRLELLSRNALAGGILVLITLVILLNSRVAFWTAIGLGVSVLGTLAFMHFAGITLNLLTMFGLIIVLGLLVDDAIVVAENITARHEKGEPADIAAVEGTNQVTWPVIATIITTVFAFFPLSLIEGNIGDLLGALPLVVACALGVSLIEALFILPSHMAHSLHKVDQARTGNRASTIERVEAKFDKYRDGLFNNAIIPAYTRVLDAALKARYLTVTLAIAVVIASSALVAGRIVEFTFLGSSDAETINAEVRMPIGTPASKTDTIVAQIESALLNNPQIAPDIKTAWAQVGAVTSIDGSSPDASNSHIGQVIIELTAVEDRELPAETLIDLLRNSLPPMPDVESLRIEEVGGGPGGTDLNYTVVGSDEQLIFETVTKVKQAMAAMEGVRDIADDANAGRRELRFHLRDGARELGFTQESIARQIRAAVFGLEAHTFAGDREDVDVRVTVPEDTRRSLAAIESLHLFTPNGTPVPAGEVVRIEESSSYATIRRLDGQRAVAVTADVDTTTVQASGRTANTEQIAADLTQQFQALAATTPGIDILKRGRQQDMEESFASLPQGLLVAVVCIYVVLAWLFSSYIQPLVVLSAVPFAVIGVILGHLVLGFDLTILSLIGFIALTGVVVNDSLILMSFYNSSRERGLSVHDACINAGQNRIRAIILTTVTTVLGLLPLMLEQSFQARFLIPMAITISCGLISATVIILVVLPCLLTILDDVKRLAAFAWSGGETSIKPVPSAIPFDPRAARTNTPH